MTEQPLVSVIINCYNSEKYLRETIDSVLAQTYQNYEVIFWDNCSTDSTAEIIKSYNDSRFRYYLAEKNTPLGEARNLAMEKVQGEYFCFLDSDDVWNDSFLSIGIIALETNKSCVAFYSNYNDWRDNIKAPHNNGRSSGIYSLKFLLNNYGLGMSAVIMRTKTINNNSISFDSSFELIEDMDFFFNVAYRGDFIYDERPLYDYRIYPENNSARKRKRWRFEFQDLYKKLEAKYVKDPMSGINTTDLQYIKKCILGCQISDFIDNNQRLEFLKIYLKEGMVRRKFKKQLVFAIVGRDLYRKMKGILN